MFLANSQKSNLFVEDLQLFGLVLIGLFWLLNLRGEEFSLIDLLDFVLVGERWILFLEKVRMGKE